MLHCVIHKMIINFLININLMKKKFSLFFPPQTVIQINGETTAPTRVTATRLVRLAATRSQDVSVTLVGLGRGVKTTVMSAAVRLFPVQ